MKTALLTYADRPAISWPAHLDLTGMCITQVSRRHWLRRGDPTADHYGASIAYSPRSVKHFTLHTCCWRCNGSDCDIEVDLPWCIAKNVFCLTYIQSGISHRHVFQLQFWLPFWPRVVVLKRLYFVQALIYESAQVWVFRDVKITVIPAISSLGTLCVHNAEQF